MITNDLIIVTLHYFGWQVMPEYHWNHWIDPIVFPYILPITQIALTGDVVNDNDNDNDNDNCVSLHPPHHPNCPHRCTVALSFGVFVIIENTNMKSHHPDCTHR